MGPLTSILFVTLLASTGLCHPVEPREGSHRRSPIPEPTAAIAQKPIVAPAPEPTGPPHAGPGRPHRHNACTSTMSVTYSRLPDPPYWPQCSWDGTERIYTATKTVLREEDCHGCQDLVVRTFPTVFCPAKIINATETAKEPLTEYRTVCKPTPTAEWNGRGRPLEERQLGVGVTLQVAAACTTPLIVPEIGLGASATRYEQLVTVTSMVPCGGCALYLSTRAGGLGPIRRPGPVSTDLTGTMTSYACTQ